MPNLSLKAILASLIGNLLLVSISAQAYASSSAEPCELPNIEGYDDSNMSCIGDGFVWLKDDKTSEFAVANAQGEIVIAFGRYKYIMYASDGLIGVGTNNEEGEQRVGFVSQRTGKEIIPLNYASASYYPYAPQLNEFSEGLIAMKLPSEKWGYLDNKGKAVIPFDYSYGKRFSEGLAPVCQWTDEEDNLCGYIDKDNQLILPFSYDGVEPFSEGLATVYRFENDRIESGVIDRQGNFLIAYQPNRKIGPFSEGLAPIVDMTNAKQGFINRAGELVIPYLYMPIVAEDIFWMPSFKNGVAQVYKYGDTFASVCINTQGDEVSCD